MRALFLLMKNRTSNQPLPTFDIQHLVFLALGNFTIEGEKNFNNNNQGKKISSTSGDDREGAFLFCREFRCWCNATTLSCYMTPCQPLTARTDVICTQLCIILIFKLPRERIYRGFKKNNNVTMFEAGLCRQA